MDASTSYFVLGAQCANTAAYEYDRERHGDEQYPKRGREKREQRSRTLGPAAPRRLAVGRRPRRRCEMRRRLHVSLGCASQQLPVVHRKCINADETSLWRSGCLGAVDGGWWTDGRWRCTLASLGAACLRSPPAPFAAAASSGDAAGPAEEQRRGGPRCCCWASQLRVRQRQNHSGRLAGCRRHSAAVTGVKGWRSHGPGRIGSSRPGPMALGGPWSSPHSVCPSDPVPGSAHWSGLGTSRAVPHLWRALAILDAPLQPDRPLSPSISCIFLCRLHLQPAWDRSTSPNAGPSEPRDAVSNRRRLPPGVDPLTPAAHIPRTAPYMCRNGQSRPPSTSSARCALALAPWSRVMPPAIGATPRLR